jgi:hypothetical protein
MLLGALSKFVMIVEPVVVIPDILSKKASLIETSMLASRKGIDPKMAIESHEKVVNRNVCLRLSSFFSCKFAKTNNPPIKIVTKDEAKKL